MLLDTPQLVGEHCAVEHVKGPQGSCALGKTVFI